jgi:hypothetical protein
MLAKNAAISRPVEAEVVERRLQAAQVGLQAREQRPGVVEAALQRRQAGPRDFDQRIEVAEQAAQVASASSHRPRCGSTACW